jgi:hypothetical protein
MIIVTAAVAVAIMVVWGGFRWGFRGGFWNGYHLRG